MLGSGHRRHDTLGVGAEQPDPEDALRETVKWPWEHREEILASETT
jgi:hypothetical protein